MIDIVAEVTSSLKGAIAQNQFLSGGLVLGALTAAVAWARHVPGHAVRWIVRRVTITVVIANDMSDVGSASMYQSIRLWLAQHKDLCRRAPSLIAGVRLTAVVPLAADGDAIDGSPAVLARHACRTQWDPHVTFTPGYGVTVFRWDGIMTVMRVIEERAVPSDGHSARGVAVVQRGAINFTFLTRDSTRVAAMIECAARDGHNARDVEDEASTDSERMQYVFMNCGGGSAGWSHSTTRAPRHIDSILLEYGMLEDIITDTKRFCTSRAVYARRGVPYHRGYLLEGPPGSGKSSLAMALAAYFKQDIYVLNMRDASMSDSDLPRMFRTAGMFILIEDIDAAGVPVRRGGSEDDNAASTGRVTLAGLLNILDGVASQEGKIFIMTTNFPDRIDPALLRPGRCDRRWHFGHASRDQLQRIFTRFFPDEDPDLARRFAESLPDRAISMAAAQGHLLIHADDALAAVRNARTHLLPYVVDITPQRCNGT